MFSAQVLVHGLKVLVTFCLKQKENEATIGGTRSRLRQDGGTGVGQGGGDTGHSKNIPRRYNQHMFDSKQGTGLSERSQGGKEPTAEDIGVQKLNGLGHQAVGLQQHGFEYLVPKN